MAIDYEHLMSLRTRGERIAYTNRQALLYAPAVGFGHDPADRNELSYVTDFAGAKTLPTFASVLAPDGLPGEHAFESPQLIPRAESVILERPLEEAGTLIVDSDVAGVFDRGAEEGALIVVEHRARRERDDQPVFAVRRTWLARADGGFGGPRGSTPPDAIPDRRPDLSTVVETRPDQALLFSLLGDMNRIHVDPVHARDLGLRGPILHAQCIFGIAGHAVLKVICEYDHTLIRSLAGTFTGPVYPGDTLTVDLWQDANVVSCRMRVDARAVVVFDHGRCVLAA